MVVAVVTIAAAGVPGPTLQGGAGCPGGAACQTDVVRRSVKDCPLPYLAEFHQFLRSSAIHARSSASTAFASDAVTRTPPAEVFLAFTVLARMSLAVTLAIFGFRCTLRRTFDAWHAGSEQYHSEWCLNANRSPQHWQRLSCRPPIQTTTQPTLSRTSIANASLSGKTLTQAASSRVPNQSSALSLRAASTYAKDAVKTGGDAWDEQRASVVIRSAFFRDARKCSRNARSVGLLHMRQ